MIGKISTPRGEHVEPLLYYLFGPGRREEHTDPHIVAGWRHPASLEPPLRPDGKRDFAKLTGLLKQPQAALGERGYARPVWHCSMRAAPDDRMLSDDEWAAIAHEVMHRTGLAPYGQEDEAVRWIAVRHGEDHIHLVAMLARQDGGKPSLSWDRYKVRAACLAAEQRYGLRSTAPADRTAARRPTRAENEKAARRGLDEAPRITLRRQVTTAAASAGSEQEFFARLDQAGVLVRKRFSTRNPGQVTGYAVALVGDTTKEGGPVWYSGGKLAPDLSWPKLQHRWTPYRVTPGAGRLTIEQRNAVWEHAARVAADAAAQIRSVGWSDPAAVTDAVWATSDTFHVAAAVLGSRILRQAADAYDRAARSPYGRIPPPTPAGNQLRQSARLLSAFAYLTGDRSLTSIVLITRLAALAEAVAELREAQQHAAQAAAARAAAEQLYAATRPAPAPRSSTVAQLASLSFPTPARPTPRPPAPVQSGLDQDGPRPPRRPSPTRPRGPSRQPLHPARLVALRAPAWDAAPSAHPGERGGTVREIEVKCHVDDLEALLVALKARGIELSDPIYQDDQAYAPDGWQFGDSKLGVSFVRLRTVDGRHYFALKQPGENAQACLEYETEVADRAAMHGAILLMGYHPTVRVAKARRTATLEHCSLCVDDVEGVGAFLELERIVPDDIPAEAIQAELAAFAASFGVAAVRTDETYDSLVHATQVNARCSA